MRKTKLLAGLLVIEMAATAVFSTVSPVKAAENSGVEVSSAEVSSEEKGSFEDADLRIHFEGKLRQREITDEYNQAILEYFELSSGNGKVNVLSKDATYTFNWENFDRTKYGIDGISIGGIQSFKKDENGKLYVDVDSTKIYEKYWKFVPVDGAIIQVPSGDIDLEGSNDFSCIPDDEKDTGLFYISFGFTDRDTGMWGEIYWFFTFNDTETSPVQFKDDSTGRTVPYYSITNNGGNWNGSQYYLEDGTLVKDAFFFDGSYTYYLQADGTPMCDKLTYHPDGEHIIYLDSNGHEVFNNFQYCPSVGYTCYFDSQGYLYKDQITFVGDKVYYLNANGAMENSGWFQFANGMDYGFANWDGTLNTSGFSYDPWGRVVFYHWNGMVARGLITDGVWYYSMDTTDGHYLGSFPVN